MNKPIPKTQRELSDNPSLDIHSQQRADQISWKDDTSKPFYIGLENIDESVLYYFENVIKPYVIQNNETIKVPVLYGSPERWKLFQKEGFYRDKNGKILLPLIMFKQSDISQNRRIGNKLDANFPHNYVITQTGYSKKSSYLNPSKYPPVKEYMVTVYPDYLTITYNCIINTYYVDQMNKLIEMINYSSNSYWGDPERFKFITSIDNFTPIVETSTGTERSVKTSFQIKLNGYIIPDIVQKSLTKIQSPNQVKITFKENNE